MITRIGLLPIPKPQLDKFRYPRIGGMLNTMWRIGFLEVWMSKRSKQRHVIGFILELGDHEGETALTV